MLVPVTSVAQFQSHRELPLLAVDMGFSGETASVGFAHRVIQNQPPISRNMTFADCVTAVAEKVAQHGDIFLIIEAPLSAAFNEKGNPQPRGTFERRPRPRWWSLGPGAAMSLAAMHFLKRLVGQIAAANKVFMIEGYVVGADSGNDADVAEALIQSASGARPCAWQEPEGRQLVSVINWIHPGASGAASPIILIPEFK